MSKTSGWGDDSFRKDIRLRFDALHHDLECFVGERVAVLQDQSLECVPREEFHHEFFIFQASDLRGPKVGESRTRLYDSL